MRHTRDVAPQSTLGIHVVVRYWTEEGPYGRGECSRFVEVDRFGRSVWDDEYRAAARSYDVAGDVPRPWLEHAFRPGSPTTSRSNA